MPDDAYDEYREKLVVETKTTWPPELGEITPQERSRIAQALHAEPQRAAQLRYVRLHTGFTREITVTPEDLRRLKD